MKLLKRAAVFKVGSVVENDTRETITTVVVVFSYIIGVKDGQREDEPL